MQAIKTTERVKRYKNLTAVDGINLEIGQGELFSLLGVNGAGKTTMIKMLTCLTKPSGGEAFVAGGMNIVYQIERLPLMIAILTRHSLLLQLSGSLGGNLFRHKEKNPAGQ